MRNRNDRNAIEAAARLETENERLRERLQALEWATAMALDALIVDQTHDAIRILQEVTR